MIAASRGGCAIRRRAAARRDENAAQNEQDQNQQNTASNNDGRVFVPQQNGTDAPFGNKPDIGADPSRRRVPCPGAASWRQQLPDRA